MRERERERDINNYTTHLIDSEYATTSFLLTIIITKEFNVWLSFEMLIRSSFRKCGIFMQKNRIECGQSVLRERLLCLHVRPWNAFLRMGLIEALKVRVMFELLSLPYEPYAAQLRICAIKALCGRQRCRNCARVGREHELASCCPTCKTRWYFRQRSVKNN